MGGTNAFDCCLLPRYRKLFGFSCKRDCLFLHEKQDGIKFQLRPISEKGIDLGKHMWHVYDV